MKQDIRNLFKEEDRSKTLPKHHRDEFLEKLENQPKRNSIFFWLRIAAVLLVAFAVSFSLLYNQQETTKITPIIAQVEVLEAEYLENIEQEWQNFIAIAGDDILVARFKKKLDDLNNDYKEVSMQFKKSPNNIFIIETLLENLQRRLQLLKDIQEHIKLLNQKSEQYETIIF